jgi:hypothetical protein
VSVPNKIYCISGIDFRHMRHENKFDEKSVGFNSVSKPSVVFLLQELFLEKTVTIRSGSESALDYGLRDIKLS